MLRSLLLNTLEVYALTWRSFPHDCQGWSPDHEAATLAAFMEFINNDPHCFERSSKLAHTTGSALVVNPSLTRVLLTHHRKLNMWLQLGGHSDGNPDLGDVAMTEAREESGLKELSFVQFLKPAFNLNHPGEVPFDLDIHRIPQSGKETPHDHYDARYLIMGNEHEKHVVSEESHDVRWFSLEEARKITEEPSMLRQFAKVERIRERLN
ncbi:MAG: NUDIX hydrolase [Proteobacteria bacterium]|nr:NUDIX hydrolase [Pseudomonadota bacterium]